MAETSIKSTRCFVRETWDFGVNPPNSWIYSFVFSLKMWLWSCAEMRRRCSSTSCKDSTHRLPCGSLRLTSKKWRISFPWSYRKVQAGHIAQQAHKAARWPRNIALFSSPSPACFPGSKRRVASSDPLITPTPFTGEKAIKLTNEKP